MTHHKDVHPAGFYAKYPEVTWDLAEERWLGYRFPNSRSDVLTGVVCMTCGWTPDPHPGEVILVLVKRRQVTELIIESQHWYQCPGEPRMKFWWLGET